MVTTNCYAYSETASYCLQIRNLSLYYAAGSADSLVKWQIETLSGGQIAVVAFSSAAIDTTVGVYTIGTPQNSPAGGDAIRIHVTYPNDVMSDWYYLDYLGP